MSGRDGRHVEDRVGVAGKEVGVRLYYYCIYTTHASVHATSHSSTTGHVPGQIFGRYLARWLVVRGQTHGQPLAQLVKSRHYCCLYL